MSCSESILCFCHKLFWVTLLFHIKDFGAYLIAGVTNTNSSVIFWVSAVTFLKYCDYNGISPYIWNRVFCVYILFKNCSNLSFNSSGAYFSNSELMLSSPVLLPFFVYFNAFSKSANFIKVSMWLLKFHSNFGTFMFVVFHNCSQYHSNTFSTMFLWMSAVSFISLLVCFIILYPSCRVPCVLCSKFVTSLSQEALCLLLTSFLPSTLFLLHSILLPSSSAAKHFLYDVIFASIKCFIQSSYTFRAWGSVVVKALRY